jgi:ribosomal protein S18 acetylase RimI-like enzyme
MPENIIRGLMRVKIRNLRPEDIGTICEFKRQSMKLSFPGTNFDGEVFSKKMLLRSKIEPDFVQVAEVSGEIAGYIAFKATKWQSMNRGRIANVFVAEKFRRMGIGRQLIRHAEKRLKKEKVKIIRLDVTMTNEGAVIFYRKMGYRAARFVMEKDL